MPVTATADSIENWCTTYTCPNKGYLHKITIRKDERNQVKVHAFGTGFPDDIDWGEVTAETYSNEGNNIPSFVAHFSPGNTKAMLIVSPISGGGSPHAGGYVECDTYMKRLDGKLQHFRQSFNSN